MKLLLLAASSRTGSLNQTLMRQVAAYAARHAVALDIVDYADAVLPAYDPDAAPPPAVSALAARFNAASGVALAVPEYNWSFPGTLKNSIDWLSTVKPNPLGGRTCFLLSATPSIRGGAGGLVQLRVPLEALGMVAFPALFPLSHADKAFDAEGAFISDTLAQDLAQMTEDFIAFTRKLHGV